MDKKNIVVTSALPYANGSIHIGHLVEYIQTDVIVRALKLAGKKVVYCCADDTHGAPIEIKASQLGIKPEELIAKFNKEHQEDFSKFHIKFDSYYSTNSKENKHFSDLIFERLKKKDWIYEKEIELTYCENCKRFLPDRYVKGSCPKCSAEDQYGDVCEKCNSAYTTVELVNPYCSICHSKPVRKKSKHYFFKLSKTSKELRKWLTSNKNLQKEVVNQILHWIDEGLDDWCISRDGPYFGFKIPGSKNKYYYVWLDAPIGYISSLTNYFKGNLKKAETYWNDSRIIHIIGKDIIYFHLLFWPAVLMHSGFALPENVLVHGFLTVNKEKMSKSRGTFLTAKEFLELANPEFLRYYYAANLSRTMTDLDLDLDDFTSRVNTELVSNIANFVYRTMSFLNRQFNGDVVPVKSDAFTKDLLLKMEETTKLYEDYELRKVVNNILYLSSEGNRYFQENEPWVLVNKDRQKAHEVLSVCTNLVKNLIILLKPIMPVYSSQVEKQLNLKDLSFKDLNFALGKHKAGKAKIIYQKIEPIRLKDSDNKFSKLNLKVAEILKVKPHPDADKLYVLQIDVGEKKQLVAGIREHYKIDELKGKKIVIVNNLEPAKLRGEKSEGMLLAATNNKGEVGLLTVDKAKPGEQVLVEGAKPNDKEITFKEFLEIEIKAKNGNAYYDGKPLKTSSEIVKVDKKIEGKVK
ncbi:MAG: methionine--tRNA ligase [Nanoarchaeota archaeon]|nr:methionine--tRNA ligase [Nanoarchaeota archaeon]MBU1854221.1 methionine--tRNA ligase [Nanoarchaeota archaeon]